MPKLKKKSPTKKSFFRPVHIQAIVFLVIYNIISKSIFFRSIAEKSLLINFMGPFVFGVIAGCIFMYLLSHEDFFHFMKEVEKVEKKTENKLVKKYIHHGKILATFLIFSLSGPVFGTITARLLIPKYRYWFWLLFVGNFISTLITVGIAKGLLVGLVR